MEVKNNDLKAAQGLLVLLAQALSFKVQGAGSLMGFGGMAFLAQRIFNTPMPSEERFTHSVRLLPTLRTAQSQMAHWIEILPMEGKEPKANPSHSFEKPKTEKEKSLIQEKAIQTKQDEQTRLAKPSYARAIIAKADPVASKASKLVEEVRLAIQSLSSSSILGAPRPAPFRAVFAKLKPLVDEFIEALSQNGLDPHQEGSFSPFKQPPVPKTPREAAAGQKGIPFNLLQETVKAPPKRESSSKGPTPSEDAPKMQKSSKSDIDERSTIKIRETKPDETISFPNSYRNGSQLKGQTQEIRRGEPHYFTSSQPVLKQTHPVATAKGTEPSQEAIERSRMDSSLQSILKMADEEQKPIFQERPPHQISLPAQMSNFSPLTASSKKKKRKRYFFKDEQEDHSDRTPF